MRLLMVCTEYPPMQGAAGWITAHLTKALRKLDLDVYVVCNECGNGDFYGLSPTNTQNSEVLLKIVNELKPDIVHIQFEAGLYGLVYDPKEPRRCCTYIDSFYTKCKTPIVTTIQSAYSLREWMNRPSADSEHVYTWIKRSGRTGIFGIPARVLARAPANCKNFYKDFLNYQAFKNLIKEKVRMSRATIVLSQHMANILGTGEVIYIGAEPAISPPLSQKEARVKYSLPQDGRRIALAIGFRTVNKGWDILERMVIPDGWIVVVNSNVKDHYNKQTIDFKWQRERSNIIDLKRGFLNDEELSMLFFAADAVVLPYRVTAGSAIMFNALGHGLPFAATNLPSFKEFAAQGVGITVKRNPHDFYKGLESLNRNYSKYGEAVDAFKQKLKWEYVARQHLRLYHNILGTEDEE
jgi:glycosyltransferase involved in cell wall biosynthesis